MVRRVDQRISEVGTSCDFMEIRDAQHQTNEEDTGKDQAGR